MEQFAKMGHPKAISELSRGHPPANRTLLLDFIGYNRPHQMKPAPTPSFKQKLWSSVEPAILILLPDIIKFLLVLAALLVGYAGLSALKAFGMSPERLAVLETLHFYAYLAVAFLFLLDMVVKISLEIFRKRL